MYFANKFIIYLQHCLCDNTIRHSGYSCGSINDFIQNLNNFNEQLKKVAHH